MKILDKKQIVVENGFCLDEDVKFLFDKGPIHYTKCSNWPDLLVEIGAFKSKNQARKAGRIGEIPYGYTEYKANKINTIYVLRYCEHLKNITENYHPVYCEHLKRIIG